MRIASFFLLSSSLFLFAREAASLPHILGIYPEEINFNSRIDVTGVGLSVFRDDAPNLMLEGVFTDRGVNAVGKGVEIPLVFINDNTLRSKNIDNLKELFGGSGAKFRGKAVIAGKGNTPRLTRENIYLDIFPINLLNSTGRLFHEGQAKTAPWWLYALIITGISLFILLGFALFAGVTAWFERRVAGRIQSRIGPNRVGPQGFLQWIADGLKCFFKEDFIPPISLPFFFRIAPYFAMVGILLTFVTLPFGQLLILYDLNVGIFYILAVTGIVVIGILISGFASNNKWSLLGGFRSAAQIISYEIPAGIAVLSIVVLSGTMSLQGIIKSQGGFPWEWHIFGNPFTLAVFVIFFISSLAEGNRTPFDLPEAESELVSGYNTEYSGMRFVFFFFAEWGNLYVISAIITALFLGGWQIPGIAPHQHETSIYLQLLGWLIFTAKCLFLVFTIIWLRWTLPRVRIDQLMIICWKYLVPIGIIAFLVNALYSAFVPDAVKLTVRLLIFAGFMLLLINFALRARKLVREGGVPLKLNPFL